MTSVYNQETATAMYLREQREIAKKEGFNKKSVSSTFFVCD